MRNIIYYFLLIALFSSCNSGCEKKIKEINIEVIDYTFNNNSLQNYKNLLNLIECDSTVYIPHLEASKFGYKDTIKIEVSYGNSINYLFDLDYETLIDQYDTSSISIKKKGENISKKDFQNFISFKPLMNIPHQRDTSIVYIIIGNQKIDMDNFPQFKHFPTIDSLRKNLNTFICNQNKKLKIYISADNNPWSQPTNPILDTIELTLNNPKNKNLDNAVFEDTINDQINNSIGDWRLFYLRARLQCLKQQKNFEELAVNDLSTAARLALNSNYGDTLMSKINALLSSDFKYLYQKDKLHRARLDGTIAGLRSKNTDLIDVPLYFLSKHPIPGFSKNIPIIHFEKIIPYKTYVSYNLSNEIVIQIVNYNSSSGRLKLNISDRASTFSKIYELDTGNGDILKIQNTTYYIRNLTDSTKPFISLSLETYNNQVSHNDSWVDDRINLLDKKIKNTSNTTLQTKYLSLKIQISAFKGIGISQLQMADFDNKIQNTK